jgi:hypothetical protein
MTHTEIEAWLDVHKIEHYTIKSDGVVDVRGNVVLETFKGHTIPVQFGQVGGKFNVSRTRLTSLRGCPHTVNGGAFSCNGSSIISLHDIHKQIKHIGGNFFCNSNTTHLLGLLLIDGINYFNIDGGGPIDKIFNKYVFTGDILSAQDELIDAGFIEQARL